MCGAFYSLNQDLTSYLKYVCQSYYN